MIDGKIYVDGKLLSDSALEQRLRRATKPHKNGFIEAGEEAKRMFETSTEDRDRLKDIFKQCLLKKVGL